MQYFRAQCFALLATLLDKPLPPDPKWALLNLKPQELHLQQFKLSLRVTTGAKKTITKAWKSTLSIVEAKNRVTCMIIREKLDVRILDRISAYLKI